MLPLLQLIGRHVAFLQMKRGGPGRLLDRIVIAGLLAQAYDRKTHVRVFLSFAYFRVFGTRKICQFLHFAVFGWIEAAKIDLGEFRQFALS